MQNTFSLQRRISVSAYLKTYETHALQEAVGLQHRLSVSAYLRTYETHALRKAVGGTYMKKAKSGGGSTAAPQVSVFVRLYQSAVSICTSISVRCQYLYVYTSQLSVFVVTF
jgi:hypothetical protein